MYIFGTSETPANFFSFNCGQVMVQQKYIFLILSNVQVDYALELFFSLTRFNTFSPEWLSR
jgi:hypothetical protein